MALIAAELYWRHAWFILVPFPLFGLAMISLSKEPPLRALGALSMLWPLSIPARSLLVTHRAAKRLGRETWVSLTPDAVLFHTAEGTGTRIGKDRILRVRHVRGTIVLMLRNYVFALIPDAAFPSPEERKRFLEALDP